MPGVTPILFDDGTVVYIPNDQAVLVGESTMLRVGAIDRQGYRPIRVRLDAVREGYVETWRQEAIRLRNELHEETEALARRLANWQRYALEMREFDSDCPEVGDEERLDRLWLKALAGDGDEGAARRLADMKRLRVWKYDGTYYVAPSAARALRICMRREGLSSRDVHVEEVEEITAPTLTIDRGEGPIIKPLDEWIESLDGRSGVLWDPYE